jgi:dipeptidyl aminopeptidase/acylaminoacyl peptidase
LEEETRKVAALTPLYWADDGDPQFLLIHGAEDNAYIFPLHSEEFAAGLQAAGSEAELLLVPGAGYASLRSVEESATIYEAMEAFLVDVFK